MADKDTLAAAPAPASDTVLAVVLRDYWDATETRVAAGTKIMITKDELIDGLAGGSLAKA